eukprot:TRINITY_DN29547_c0_g1_i1.p1 TRINITY_DN29547_c0_g1~~TRINITY_DN29547_c0_g1_i1.p1  ORF type:complete len:354 (-),score=72.07 TRINITY_DN29547_c0_g1_i1:418-1479(-)
MAELNSVGWAAHDSSGKLSPFKFHRREIGPSDVEIDVKFCGICHSDYHQVMNEWGGSQYPMVPGHEIAGVVTKVGDKVTKFKVGDHAGVGCMVGSCGKCDGCGKHLEQYCAEGVIWTYNSKTSDGLPTYGGYSNRMVADEKFVLSIPESIPLDVAAPLLCAGITVYSPMTHFGFNNPGKSMGVVGLGGLGHMAVKIGKAMGLKVTVLSTSPNKKEEALGVLQADHFVVTKDEEQFKAAKGSLDYVIDTVSAPHDLAAFLGLLKVDGKYVVVGVPPTPYTLSAGILIGGRKTLGGSLIGGILETQEMLDFCGKHDVKPLIEKISIDYVNTAMERLHKADVKYRFVIDCSTIKEA